MCFQVALRARTRIRPVRKTFSGNCAWWFPVTFTAHEWDSFAHVAVYRPVLGSLNICNVSSFQNQYYEEDLFMWNCRSCFATSSFSLIRHGRFTKENLFGCNLHIRIFLNVSIFKHFHVRRIFVNFYSFRETIFTAFLPKWRTRSAKFSFKKIRAFSYQQTVSGN